MIKIAVEKIIDTHLGKSPLSFDLEFELGSVNLISGPSGAGKTTFLKILAGLIPADHGRISVGDNLWFDSERQYSKRVQDRGIGFVFQDYALFPNMTVMQHLNYASDDQRYIDELISIGRLENLKARLPNQLSGGQQQRLAILRALATKPSMILMDEPFSALDQELKAGLIDELLTMFSKLNATVLIVTHNLSELDQPWVKKYTMKQQY